MVDFSKLRVLTHAELQVDDERRQAHAIAADTARRREWSRKSITITLCRDAECHFTMSGAQVIHLNGSQPDGKPARATWYAPDHLDRHAFSAIMATLAKGTKINLKGYWKPFKGASGTTFTFIAQFVEASASE